MYYKGWLDENKPIPKQIKENSQETFKKKKKVTYKGLHIRKALDLDSFKLSIK